ncbi:MAG: phosphohydrolase [Thermoprotei archaeon]|nr:MAG: phosphohydrolase [Thermoprotei archaeon]RLF19129.1 MAG: phosphohydrolase [Thermoprotei archaeon]
MGNYLEVVGPDLIIKHVTQDSLLEKAYMVLEEDEEIQDLMKMANVMAVTRLKYNDHGVVHARIVAGAALELLDLLIESGIVPTTIRDKVVPNVRLAKLVVMIGAYLHDIGNAIHRDNHHIHGCILARPILDRILPQLVPRYKMFEIRQEILHIIYAHDERVQALTLEAGVVKVADGTDMAEGRARVPYRLGKADIHAVSALAIKRVYIGRGEEKPIKILVEMRNPAGLFQIENVFMLKVRTSGIENLIELSTSMEETVV